MRAASVDQDERMIGLITAGDVVAAALVGLLATVVMNVPMGRLPEGQTAPAVAAAVLTDTHPDTAPERVATLVHYVAGTGTGILFLSLVVLLGQVLPVTLAQPLAGGVLFIVMVAFFILVPLPRAGQFSRHRLDLIKRDWAVSAVAYVVVAGILLWIIVPGLP